MHGDGCPSRTNTASGVVDDKPFLLLSTSKIMTVVLATFWKVIIAAKRLPKNQAKI